MRSREYWVFNPNFETVYLEGKKLVRYQSMVTYSTTAKKLKELGLTFEKVTYPKKPCPGCPFRKTSERGFTTFEKERRGKREAFIGLAKCIRKGSPQKCHTTIQTKGYRCIGFRIFEQGGNSEIFSNYEEFKSHHVLEKKK